MNEKKLVSIVVPIYKVEEYLEECVDSILNQSYKEFEVILVDDGSPDRCGEICDRYAECDSRIRVIHKKNGGLSDARNAGIEIARGEYIAFIDSDDYVTPNYLEMMVSTAEIHNADIVQCQNTLQTDNLGTLKYKKPIIYSASNTIFKEYLLFNNIIVCAQQKLYRTSLFREIRFPVGRINEDTCTTYKLLLHAERYVCIGNILYFYRIREGSIMHSEFTPQRFEILKVPDEIRFYLGNEKNEYAEELVYYEFRIKVYLYNILIRTGNSSIYQHEMDLMRRDIVCTGYNRYINFKYILIKIILRYNKNLYQYIVQKM